MKKLTAGIFTVLMGLVSVNAADAAVASKAYVDAKAASEASAVQTAAATALSSAKTELEGKIDAKVAQTAYDAKIEALEAADATFATKTALEQGLATKQATIDDLQTIRDGAALGATSFQAANVAKKLDQVPQGKDDELVPTVKRAQDMINNSQTELISAVSDNTDAIALINDAENGILAAAKSDAEKYIDADELSASQTAQDTVLKKYADDKDTALKTELEGKITTASGSASQVASDLASYITSNNAAVEAAQADATQALADAATAKTQADKGVADAATAKTQADKGVADAATAKSAADAAQAAADAAAAAAAAAQTAADDAQADATQALADAAAAQSAADDAQATANAAIPAPSDACSNPTNKCVLTYNNAVYEWEVIERSGGQ